MVLRLKDKAATTATYAVFGGLGFNSATWASRIPQVRSHFGLRPSQLGVVLLAMAAGSVVSLPLSGPVVTRIGSRHGVAAISVVSAVAFGVLSLGYLVGLVPIVIGLFVLGIANGFWDVAMNVQAAAVERLTGRSIMSRFHAGFSIGAVAGALVGTACVALHVPVSVHFAIVALLLVALMPFSAARFTPDHDSGNGGVGPTKRSALAPWLEMRTLLVGVVVLAFAFSEGAGNDWISVSLIDDHHVAAAVGTLGYAVFLTCMTTARWFGSSLLDRYGRVAVLRALALTAGAGIVAFALSPSVPVALVGVALWGVGSSLGFPTGMSAGADEPAYAAGRVSVIASIGYCAFLGGPPLIGILGNHLTVTHATLAVALALVSAVLLAGSTRPRGSTPTRPGDHRTTESRDG